MLSCHAGCHCGLASGARSRVLYSSSFSMRSTCIISMRSLCCPALLGVIAGSLPGHAPGCCTAAASR